MKINFKKVFAEGVATIALVAPLTLGNVNTNANARVRHVRTQRVSRWVVRRIDSKYSGDKIALNAINRKAHGLQRALRHAKASRHTKRGLQRKLRALTSESNALRKEVIQSENNDLKSYQKSYQVKTNKRNKRTRNHHARKHMRRVRHNRNMRL